MALRDKVKKYKGLILLTPAIKDNPNNAKIGKAIVKLISYVAPKMKTVDMASGMGNRNPAINEI